MFCDCSAGATNYIVLAHYRLLHDSMPITTTWNTHDSSSLHVRDHSPRSGWINYSSPSVVFIAHHRRYFRVPTQVSVYLQPLRAGQFPDCPVRHTSEW